MVETLAFYSHCNKGDIHVSRELVKLIIKAIPAKHYVYAHQWSPRLLLDLPVIQTKEIASHNQHAQFGYDPSTHLLTLNTWYGVSPSYRDTSCTLNTLVDLFSFQIKRHGINCKMPPIEQMIPRIDYSKYHIAAASSFMETAASRWRKRVMICDGPVLSGQTGGTLEDFRAAAEDAARAHPDVLFLMTERGTLRLPNVAYTADVIGLKGETDLCECSYVSTKCDVVIGRGSGPYTFSYVAENFLDPKKTMLCFTNEETTAQWIYPKQVVKARMLWSTGYDRVSVRKKIEATL